MHLPSKLQFSPPLHLPPFLTYKWNNSNAGMDRDASSPVRIGLRRSGNFLSDACWNLPHLHTKIQEINPPSFIPTRIAVEIISGQVEQSCG